MKRIAFVLASGLIATAGCKKKEDAAPAPASLAKGGSAAKPPAAGSAKGSGSAAPVAATAPTGAALATWYRGCWDSFNAGKLDELAACYAADVKSTWVDGGPTGDMVHAGVADSMKQTRDFKTGFPDARGDLQLVMVSGKTIAGVVLTHGTNTGAMPGMGGQPMPATGKKMGMLTLHLLKVNDAGKVAEEWWVQDQATMAGQLGLMPMPVRPAMDKGADGAPVVVVTADDANEKANLAAWNASMEAFNKHDLAGMMAVVADDAVVVDPGAPADDVGRAAIEASTKAFLGMFSDGKMTSKQVLAAGDYVLQVSTFTGTNDGENAMMKSKATGKPVTVTVAEVGQFKAGKVSRMWRFYNGVAFAAQLGMMGPPPGADGADGAKADADGADDEDAPPAAPSVPALDEGKMGRKDPK